MIYATTFKSINVTPPAAAVNNATVTTPSVDRKGYDYACYKIVLGATDVGLTALKLQESDDNATFADIPGLDYSVAPATLPTNAQGGKIFAFDVDLRGRKRYLKPIITIGAGTTGAFITVQAELHRGEQIPKDAATRGLAATLSV
jgi:hypothetical protein